MFRWAARQDKVPYKWQVVKRERTQTAVHFICSVSVKMKEVASVASVIDRLLTEGAWQYKILSCSEFLEICPVQYEQYSNHFSLFCSFPWKILWNNWQPISPSSLSLLLQGITIWSWSKYFFIWMEEHSQVHQRLIFIASLLDILSASFAFGTWLFKLLSFRCVNCGESFCWRIFGGWFFWEIQACNDFCQRISVKGFL